MIPSSIYNVMENLVYQVRQKLERGWVIQIGHKWARGGADRLARCLGVTLKNCWDKSIEEGDYDGLDVSVLEPLLNMYFSSMLMHEKPGSADYEIKKKLLTWLIMCQIKRIVFTVGDVVVEQEGGVPSGMFNTSHCDSWVTGLLFFLFVTHVIHTAPPEQQAELQELAIEYIMYICYGDDLLYNLTMNPLAHQYFNIDKFGRWVKDYFNMNLRDTKHGLSFLSRVSGGWLVETGASYLKHNMVENPCKDPGQSNFLPFRESREVLIRAVYGRESKSRDPIDVMLSLVGHAWGTYGSNRDCFLRLQHFFVELVGECEGTHEEQLKRRLETLDSQSVRKMRQMGITPEEIAKGFPNWDDIVAKNIVDWAYQDICVDDYDVDPDNDGEFLF